MALNAKQQEFVNHYLTGFNATQAALAAGYSEKTAYSHGARLLKNVEISTAIKEHLSETAMGAEEVLMRLAEQARCDIGDLLTASGELDLEKTRLTGKTRLIKKLTNRRIRRISDKGETEEIVTIVELYDAQSALKLLGDNLGLWKGTPDAPQHVVNYTHDEWVAEQEKRRQQAQQALADFADDE